MSKKFYIIVNPHGGGANGNRILEKVKPIFKKSNCELAILETNFRGHAKKYANELPFKGFDGLCIIGGDGSMHEIVNGMLTRKDKKKIPIGIITGGTGNSFMRDVDCLNPEEAAMRILKGIKRPIDIAKINANGETIFAFNIVGWGMATDINLIAEKLRWFGNQRYNIASIIEVFRNRERLARIKIDGKMMAGDYGIILGCLTKHTGRGMKMAPLARLDDGLIDLVIARKPGKIKMLKLFSKIFSGKHIGNPIFEYHQVKEFSILPNDDSPLNIDGEMIGSTPFNVKVIKNGIEVLV